MKIFRLYYLLPLFIITGPLLSDLLVSLTSLYFLYYFFKYEKNFIKTKLNLYFLIFYIFLIIVTFFSIDFKISLKSSLPYFRFFLFSLIICYLIEKRILNIQIFYYIISIIVVVFFLDSLFQLYFDKNILGQVSPLEYRITSFFGDEAVLGSYIFKLYFLFCFLDHIIEIKHKNIIFYLITFATIVILVISGDRTPFFLCTIFFSILLFFSNLKKQYLYSLLTFIFISIFILSSNVTLKNRILLMTTEGFFNTLEKFGDGKIKSEIEIEIPKKNNLKYYISDQHHAHFIIAKEIFFKNILTGTGPNTFRFECSKDQYQNNLSNKYKFENKGCSTHPHNFYFQLASETGLIGLLFILGLFLISAFKIIYSFVNKENFDFAKLMVYLYLFLILFPISPSGNFFNNWSSILNYFPIGFFIYYFRNSSQLRSR